MFGRTIRRVVATCSVTVFLLLPSIAFAKPAGSWQLAGTTSDPLIAPRLIAVPGGNVVALDYEGDHDLYKPATNTWTTTSDPPIQIGQGFTATKTADGKIFVTGGGEDTLAAIYDPAKDSWAPAASSAFGHEDGIAALLSDGEILVAGGENCVSGSCTTTTESELYDPKKDSWRSTGPMIASELGGVTVTLGNRDVMVFGGEADPTSCGMRLGCPQIYHAPTGKWRLAAGMLSEQLFCAGATLKNGKVLAAGGVANAVFVVSDIRRRTDDVSSPRPVKLAEIYDPASDSWKMTTKMHFSRGVPTIYLFFTDGASSATATLLTSGRVLVTGGSNTDSIIGQAEVYDPATKAWLNGGMMPQPRVVSSATRLKGGGVLVAGGVDLYGNVEQADIYHP